jgi:hypothetical protein
MVASEKHEREAHERFQRDYGMTLAEAVAPKPPSTWRPPSMGGGEAPAPKQERPFLDTDGGLILE